MLVEANPDRASQLQQLYCHRLRVACVCAWVELNGPNSLCSLLERYECPDTVDVLSIDVDGADYHIWAVKCPAYLLHLGSASCGRCGVRGVYAGAAY